MNQTTEECVLQYYIQRFTAFSVGIYESRWLSYNPRYLAVDLGAQTDKVCFAKAASGPSAPGFRVVSPAQYGAVQEKSHDTISDAVLLEDRNSAVIFRVGDCPIMTVYEQRSHRLLVAHCGRPAMTPLRNGDGQIENIVSIGFRKLLQGVENPRLRVHVTGSICANHFAHDTPEGQALIAPFDHFGRRVFVDRRAGKLDLVKVIQSQVRSLLPEDTLFTHDRLCPYETEWLASHRRHPELRLRSPAIVVLH